MRADWLVPSGRLNSSKFGPFASGSISTGDYAIERWRFEQQIRMTRREVKDELRQMEGDAATRHRRRELASSIARKVS